MLDDDGIGKLREENAELRTELRLLKNDRSADSWLSLSRYLIKYAGLVIIVYLISDAIPQAMTAIAGKTTDFDFNATFMVSQALAWALAAVFGGLYKAERKRRKKAIEYFTPKIKEQEQEEDPDRTSSELTESGDTPPEEADYD